MRASSPTRAASVASDLTASETACQSEGWPRAIDQRPWFAWRPVRLNGNRGRRWVWLRTVMKTRLAHRAGDFVFESNVYALLP